MVSRILGIGALGLVALAIGCAHGAAAAGQRASVNAACDRGRADADRYALRAAEVPPGPSPRLTAQVLYDQAATDYYAAAGLRGQADALVRSSRDWSGFRMINPEAERCRLARQREREAQQAILIP
jgi:hypothetical protein